MRELHCKLAGLRVAVQHSQLYKDVAGDVFDHGEVDLEGGGGEGRDSDEGDSHECGGR